MCVCVFAFIVTFIIHDSYGNSDVYYLCVHYNNNVHDYDEYEIEIFENKINANHDFLKY